MVANQTRLARLLIGLELPKLQEKPSLQLSVFSSYNQLKKSWKTWDIESECCLKYIPNIVLWIWGDWLGCWVDRKVNVIYGCGSRKKKF